MRKRLVIACLAGAFVLSGCGGGSRQHYPTNIRVNFLNACEASGGAVSKCGCSLKWFESHVSLARFTADEHKSENGSFPSDFRRAIRACG
jgi:hypothetical protein